MKIEGIDVSKHNGIIDWQAVAGDGVQFAIIRAGWSWFEGGLSLDSRFCQNMQGAQAAGLDVGVYLYAYDLTPQAAKHSAQRLVEALQGYKPTYPIYYDQEYEPQILALSTRERTAICKAFLETMQSAGFYTGLYASADWLQNRLDMQALSAFDVWVAQYAGTCTYKGPHGMWQHGVIGSVGTKGKDYTIPGYQPGVLGNCDQNWCYKDYPALITSAGLNGWSKPVPEPPEQPTEPEPPKQPTEPEPPEPPTEQPTEPPDNPPVVPTDWAKKYNTLAAEVLSLAARVQEGQHHAEQPLAL